MQLSPIHTSHDIFASVLMLASANVTRAAMATKIAVHAPCVETALSPIDVLRIAEAETKISSEDLVSHCDTRV